MSYWDLKKTVKNPWTIRILRILFLWISLRFLIIFLLIYLFQNFMHIIYQSMRKVLCIHSFGNPQCSMLSPILFNILIIDLFLFMKDDELATFADDNTIYTMQWYHNSIWHNRQKNSFKILEKESKSAQWMMK